MLGGTPTPAWKGTPDTCPEGPPMRARRGPQPIPGGRPSPLPKGPQPLPRAAPSPRRSPPYPQLLGSLLGEACVVVSVPGLLSAEGADGDAAALAEESQHLVVGPAAGSSPLVPQGPRQPRHGTQRAVGPQRAGGHGGAALGAGGGARWDPQHLGHAGAAEVVAAFGDDGLGEELQADGASGLGLKALAQRQHGPRHVYRRTAASRKGRGGGTTAHGPRTCMCVHARV